MCASVERCVLMELPHRADREPQFLILLLPAFEKGVEASVRRCLSELLQCRVAGYVMHSTKTMHVLMYFIAPNGATNPVWGLIQLGWLFIVTRPLI